MLVWRSDELFDSFPISGNQPRDDLKPAIEYPPEIALYDHEELLNLEAASRLAKDSQELSSVQALLKAQT